MTIILETDSSVEIEIDAPETLHCTETKNYRRRNGYRNNSITKYSNRSRKDQIIDISKRIQWQAKIEPKQENTRHVQKLR